jgi:hypothetical protein
VHTWEKEREVEARMEKSEWEGLNAKMPTTFVCNVRYRCPGGTDLW